MDNPIYAMIHIHSSRELRSKASGILQNALESRKEGYIHVGIPGGRSIEAIIRAVCSLDPDSMARIKLQLIDERLSGNTNTETIMDYGLREAIDSGTYPEENYRSLTEKTEPEPFDLLFAGIGEDGHFASNFPGSHNRHYSGNSGKSPATVTDRPTVERITDSPKPPSERVTITYSGFRRLASSAHIYLIALGESKRSALEKIQEGESPDSVPAAFFMEGFEHITFITDIIPDGKHRRSR